MAEEFFETYAIGDVEENTFTAGTGWDGTGEIITPHVRPAGEETFETYGLGGISESALTDGTGWNGGAALFAY